MINTNKLRGIIAEKGFTQPTIAKTIGITPKTFYEKMKKGVFSNTEIEALTEALDISNPLSVFFPNLVAQQETKTSEVSSS